MEERALRKIRVALIGYGRSGRNIHLSLLRQLPEKYEIAAFVDFDAERRALIRRENGLEALPDYRCLFGRQDIDLVVNASYSFDHAHISYDLLANGFDVLSEKPAARDADEFAAVARAARERGRRYFVFQQYRFAPAYRRIREIIGSGALGRVVQFTFTFDSFARRWDWQTVHGFNAGNLHNMCPHPIDWALDMMGFPEDVSVFCAMDRAHASGDGEDFVKLFLRAPGAPLGEIEVSGVFGYGKDTYEVQGTRGCLTGTDAGLKWQYYRDGDAPARPLDTRSMKADDATPIYGLETLPLREETWRPTGYEIDAFNAKGLGYYNALYETLTAGVPFPVKSEHILLQMKVMDEGYRQNAALFR